MLANYLATRNAPKRYAMSPDEMQGRNRWLQLQLFATGVPAALERYRQESSDLSRNPLLDSLFEAVLGGDHSALAPLIDTFHDVSGNGIPRSHLASLSGVVGNPQYHLMRQLALAHAFLDPGFRNADPLKPQFTIPNFAAFGHPSISERSFTPHLVTTRSYGTPLPDLMERFSPGDPYRLQSRAFSGSESAPLLRRLHSQFPGYLSGIPSHVLPAMRTVDKLHALFSHHPDLAEWGGVRDYLQRISGAHSRAVEDYLNAGEYDAGEQPE